MLVLERKDGELIKLSNGVSILVKIKGRQVRIGVKAPTGVRILRGELVGDDWPEESQQTLSATPAETTVT